MTFIADFKGVKVEYKIASPKYWRIQDTIEQHGMSRVTYNEKKRGDPVDPNQTGLPDVYRINPVIYRDRLSTHMTRDFQFWIYRINVDRQFGYRLTAAEHSDFYLEELKAYKAKTGGQTIRDFNSLFRSKGSHTNYAGVNICKNYIAQENLTEEYGLPMFSNVVTGRWVGNFTGKQAAVINASKPYMHYHPDTDPMLFDQPLSTGRILQEGTNIILRDDIRRRYNDFNERVVMPVILPMDDFGYLPDAVIVESSDPPLRKL